MAQTKIRTEQIEGGTDGWIPMPDTYAIGGDDEGLDTITVDNNDINYLSEGMRIKIRQNSTTYYGIVHKLDGDVTATSVYVFFSVDSGTRNRLDGTAVSDMYYSREKCPYGFPSDTGSWTLSGDIDGLSSSVSGRTVSNIGSETIVIPLGVWDLNVSISRLQFQRTAGGEANFDVSWGLCSTNSTEPANGVEYAAYIGRTDASGYIRTGAQISKIGYGVGSETTLYSNGYVYAPNESNNQSITDSEYYLVDSYL